MEAKLLNKISLQGDILITDPFYFVKPDKLENIETKPLREQFYPDGWDFSAPIEIDSGDFEISLNSEHEYQKACQSWSDTNPSEWDVCNYGDSLDILGFKHWITCPTIYGPWGCTVYDRHNQNKLGRFSSDTGAVGVYLLSEVLHYNPSYNTYRSKPWTGCVIPNFEGTVLIANFGGKDEATCDIRIVGKGNVNFYTKQTDF